MRQRKIGNILVLFGLLVTALGLMTKTAGATDDLEKYQDKVTKIEGSRTYDADSDTTTFVFNATFSETVSHLVIASCPEGTNIIEATGPSGVKVEKNVEDNGQTHHVGAKFEPGKSGTYTVKFSGNLAGADFIVKNGKGHKHYSMGSGCSGEPVTTSSSSSSSTTSSTEPESTTSSTEPESTTSSTEPESSSSSSSSSTTSSTLLPDVLGETTTTEEPSSSTATTAPSSTTTTEEPSVLGTQLEKPSEQLKPAPSVEGTQETQGANIPATGSNTGDYLLLAGLALALGGLAVRFGEAEAEDATAA